MHKFKTYSFIFPMFHQFCIFYTLLSLPDGEFDDYEEMVSDVDASMEPDPPLTATHVDEFMAQEKVDLTTSGEGQ